MQHCEIFAEKTREGNAVTSICHHIPLQRCKKKKGANDDAVSRTLSVDAYSKRLVSPTNYVKTALEHQKREERQRERVRQRKK